MRQVNGFSQIPFNSVLKKVVRDKREGISEKEFFMIGRRIESIRTDCLAIAHDVTILTNDIEAAKKRVK